CPFEARVLHTGRLVQQIRAPQIAREDEVPAEEIPGARREGGVGDEEREMLRCVPRRVAGGDRDRAELDRVAVVEALGREVVLPVLAALSRDIGGRARRRGELARPREEVRMDMGLGHGDDPQTVMPGEVEIVSDVAPRIDHERLPAVLAGHEIARLGEVLVVEAFEKHGSSWGLRGTVTGRGRPYVCGPTRYRGHAPLLRDTRRGTGGVNGVVGRG